MDDEVKAILEGHERQIQEMRLFNNTTNTAIEDLKSMIVGLSLQMGNSTSQSRESSAMGDKHVAYNHQTGPAYNTGNRSTIQPQITHLEFPRFNGEDPDGWIYRGEQFFRFNLTPEPQKVPLASFHLEKEALQWYQWLEKYQGVISWKEFVEGLCTRFGPNMYEDYTGELTKLRQTSTVRDYQSRFEQLANRTLGLTEDFFCELFHKWAKR
eukprot:TRINITY_DN1235_c2_g1_i1.p1 TRINITY_DN1235_c2_g1~~TRINITY_DN1235_c2_g1_i1.p1  ORF type:complete len:211 (+),score=26.64 TRINITY_DN1235_c2_g1_i1:150-782(+)